MEELVPSVKAEGNVGCRDCEMMESRILRKGNKANSRTKPVDLGDLAVLSDQLGRIPWTWPWRKRGP